MNALLPAIPVEHSATFALTGIAEAGLEPLIDPVLSAPDWSSRLVLLDAFMSIDPPADRFGIEAQSRILTALLEQIGEQDIRSTEAALAYRLTIHASWRDAAKRYLDAVPHDDVIAALESHPGIGVFTCQWLAIEPQL